MYWKRSLSCGGHPLTRHAEERMAGRGISHADVERALAGGARSDSRGDARVQCGDIVVVLSGDGVIKTVIRKD